MNSALMSLLDPVHLNELAIKYHKEYLTAQPFPHIVIDNFLPEFILDDILNEFPKVDSIDWQKFEAASEKKLASKNETQMGDKTRLLLYQLNSSILINSLEGLTGINGLVPDPHFEGGGLHQIERGGYLKMHVDFNKHRKLQLERRLNLIVYLNKDWQEEYGGHLELWNRDMTHCEKKILPIFNRCVVFNTSDFSYHGHPEPLSCPENQTRKSLALYYYSKERPAEETSFGHSHSSIFRSRPGEKLVKQNSLVYTVRTVLKKITPPILIDARNFIRKI